MDKQMTEPEHDPASPLGEAEVRYLATLAVLGEARRAAGEIGHDLHECEDAWASATYQTTTPAAFAECDARRTLLLRANAVVKHQLAQAETSSKAAELSYRQKSRSLQNARESLTKAEKFGRRAEAERARAVIEQLTTPARE